MRAKSWRCRLGRHRWANAPIPHWRDLVVFERSCERCGETQWKVPFVGDWKRVDG